MQTALPTWLLDELDSITDVAKRNYMTEMVRKALTESVRTTLGQLATVRHLVLYFSIQADWASTLQVIRDALSANAVQVVCLDGLDSLEYHLLPAEQSIDEDFNRLLHDGLTIDDQDANGKVRLGVLLAINDDLLGVLMVIRDNGEPFTDYDRVLLTNFADEMAIALYNIELYSLLREQADHLASLIRQEHPADSATG